MSLPTPILSADHGDERGNVRELFRQSWGAPRIRQMTVTTSLPGALRGMHYHRRQWDAWSFIAGEAIVQLYDPASPGDWTSYLMRPGMSLLIPPGIAHGWMVAPGIKGYGISSFGATLIYGLTQEYDGRDEDGFNPLDPAYPGSAFWYTDPILSERDANGKSLDEFLASL